MSTNASRGHARSGTNAAQRRTPARHRGRFLPSQISVRCVRPRGEASVTFCSSKLVLGGAPAAHDTLRFAATPVASADTHSRAKHRTRSVELVGPQSRWLVRQDHPGVASAGTFVFPVTTPLQGFCTAPAGWASTRNVEAAGAPCAVREETQSMIVRSGRVRRMGDIVDRYGRRDPTRTFYEVAEPSRPIAAVRAASGDACGPEWRVSLVCRFALRDELSWRDWRVDGLVSTDEGVSMRLGL